MIKESIILAGGLGKRLRGVVSEVPKPMAIIKGKPFLEHLLIYLEKEGIKKVILTVGYKREVIQKHFGNKFNNITVQYSVEEEPLGTGGAIKRALELVENADVLILNGDTYFKINLKKLTHFHYSKNADVTIALKSVHNTGRYGVIEINEKNRILKFYEKSKKIEGLINGGIYIVKKKIFLSSNLPPKFSFEKEFLEKYVSTLKFYGLPFDSYFIDIGTPEDYERAIKEFEP